MNPIFLSLAVLLASAVVIYLACEYFVNGVEWVGRKLSVGQQATGAILAAFGTALPESVITFIAVVFGATAAQKSLGVGAALGGPLVLATIGYAVVGITLMLGHRYLPRTDTVRQEFKRLSRDQGWFLIIFIAKLGLGLFAFAYKPWLGVLFLAAYCAYFWKEMRAEQNDSEGELEPLKLTPKQASPSTWVAVAQTLAAPPGIDAPVLRLVRAPVAGFSSGLTGGGPGVDCRVCSRHSMWAQSYPTCFFANLYD